MDRDRSGRPHRADCNTVRPKPNWGDGGVAVCCVAGGQSDGSSMKTRLDVLALIVFFGGITLADFAQSANQPAEQVTRSGPYVVKKTFTAEPYNVPRTTTSVSRDINTQDLDLTSDGDVAKLEARVRQVAEDVCRQLDQRRPRSTDISRDQVKNCVKITSESA